MCPAKAGRSKPMTDVTSVLSTIENGDPLASELLLPLVYDEHAEACSAPAGKRKTRPSPPGDGPRS